MSSKQKEIAYFSQNGRYLVYTIKGECFILESKEELEKYIKENNCKIVKH